MNLKRLIAALLSVTLLLGISTVALAAEDIQEETKVGQVESVVSLEDGTEIHYYDNGYFAIIRPVEKLPSVARTVDNIVASKDANYYDNNGKMAAYLKMTGYFQVDQGVESYCYNIVCGYTPYNSWNVSIVSKSSTPRGDSVTAKAVFRVSKIGRSDDIELKVTVDKYGKGS